MALTETTRLKLAKMSLGDVSWHTNLNAGMDNADSRIFRLRTLEAGTPIDPNASIQAHFKGQVYLDDTSIPMILWWARNTAAPSVWEQLSTKSLINPVPIRTFALLDAILGKLDTDLAATAATVAALPAQLTMSISRHDKTTAQAVFAQNVETEVTNLVNLPIPGGGNGVKVYRCLGQLTIPAYGNVVQYQIRVRVGPLGTKVDPVVGRHYFTTQFSGGPQTFEMPSRGFVPALNDKVTITFESSAGPGGEPTISNVAVESFLTIEQIS